MAVTRLPVHLWAVWALGSMNRTVAIGSSTKLVCQLGGALEREYYRITDYDMLSMVQLTEEEAQSLYDSLTAVVPVATTSYEAPRADLSNGKKLVVRDCGECPFLQHGGGFGRIAYIPRCGKSGEQLPFTTAASRNMLVARREPGIPDSCPLEDN